MQAMLRYVRSQRSKPSQPPPTVTKSEYYTRYEAAKLLRITVATLRNWVRDGKIKAVQQGWRVFFHKDEVARMGNHRYRHS